MGKEGHDELDSIDNELLRLLNMRARVVVKTGGRCAARAEAEAALGRACHANAGPLGEQAVARIFRRIMREMRGASHRRDDARRAWLEESPHEEVGELV
jgi:chorismate mutase